MTTTNRKSKQQLDEILNQGKGTKEQTRQSSPKNNRNTERASSGANTIQGKLDKVSREMANSMKKAVGAQALNYLLEDLSHGDLGDFFDEQFDAAFENFTHTIDAETIAIESGEREAFLLPYAPGESSEESNSNTKSKI